jgi:hypothetical protein
MVHDTRIVPLDGRPALGASIRQYMGDSRGRFEEQCFHIMDGLLSKSFL